MNSGFFFKKNHEIMKEKLFMKTVYKCLLGIMLVLLLVFLVVMIALKWNENKLMFYPVASPSSSILVSGCTRVHNGIKYSESNNSKKAIVLYHGNAGNATHCMIDMMELLYLNNTNLSVVEVDLYVFEYSGFGLRRNESLKQQDEFLSEALEFFQSVSTNYQSVSFVGFSLGSGVASHVLAHAPPHVVKRILRLVLIVPYSSIRDAINEQTNGLLGWATGGAN